MQNANLIQFERLLGTFSGSETAKRLKALQRTQMSRFETQVAIQFERLLGIFSGSEVAKRLKLAR